VENEDSIRTSDLVHLLNRFEVGKDGFTAFERCKKKKAKSIGVEFGEAIFWRKKPAGGAAARLASVWNDGVFIGVRGKSGEVIIADADGVWKTRSIQRKPIQDRWDPSSADLVKHVPWRSSEGDPDGDGEVPEVIRLAPDAVPPEREVVEEKLPRNASIAKADLEKHGYSARCPGCQAILRGRAHQAHSIGCRKRLEEEMKNDPKVERAKRKFHDVITEAVEKDEKNRKTREEANARENEPGLAASSSCGPDRSRSSHEDKPESKAGDNAGVVRGREPTDEESERMTKFLRSEAEKVGGKNEKRSRDDGGEQLESPEKRYS